MSNESNGGRRLKLGEKASNGGVFEKCGVFFPRMIPVYRLDRGPSVAFVMYKEVTALQGVQGI